MSDLFWRPRPEDVVRDHGPRVHRLLRRLFIDKEIVDDVYQSVFLEVLRSLPRFEGRSRLSTWIHRVALNVAYQEMRQQYGRARLVAVDADGDLAAAVTDPTDGGDPHGGAERRQAAERLQHAMNALPPKQRLAVALHDLEGCTLREIAEDLGIPTSTVASQVRLGREALSRALRDLAAGGARVRGPKRAVVGDDNGADDEREEVP